MRPLIHVSHPCSQEEQRNPIRSVRVVQDGEYGRRNHDRPPSEKAPQFGLLHDCRVRLSSVDQRLRWGVWVRASEWLKDTGNGFDTYRIRQEVSSAADEDFRGITAQTDSFFQKPL